MRHARRVSALLFLMIGCLSLARWLTAGEAPAPNQLAPVKASTASRTGLDRTVLPIPEPRDSADHRARRPERQGSAAGSR